jgi:hypothetical protein
LRSHEQVSRGIVEHPRQKAEVGREALQKQAGYASLAKSENCRVPSGDPTTVEPKLLRGRQTSRRALPPRRVASSGGIPGSILAMHMTMTPPLAMLLMALTEGAVGFSILIVLLFNAVR